MIPARRRLLGLLSAAGPALAFPWASRAQPARYPDRPLRLFVPFGPGSGSDVYARHFGRQLGERIGQAVVVENKPGAGGAVAVQATQTAPADGYTVLLGSNSPMAVNVSAFKSLPYDPLQDVTPICGLTRSMAVIAVPARSPLNTIADLVERGKAQPPLNMGTYSPGYQLAVAPFLHQAGFLWQDIPYRGLSQTTADLVGNQLDVAVVDTPGTVQIIKSGQIRALAVTGTQRHPELPDVPTLVELGYPEATHYSWTSLWLRAGTPEPIVSLLAGHMLDILADASSRTFVEANSGEIMPYGPEEMRRFQQAEIKRFSQAVQTLGFQPT